MFNEITHTNKGDGSYRIEAPTLIIGAGGAMTQLCVGLDMQRGRLKDVLQRSVCAEGGSLRGLSQVVYPANTKAHDISYYLCDRQAALAGIEETTINQKLRKSGEAYPCLPDVQALIYELRSKIFSLAAESGNPRFAQPVNIYTIREVQNGRGPHFESQGRNTESGEGVNFHTNKILFAPGGQELPLPELMEFEDKLIMSGDAGSKEGMSRMLTLLAQGHGKIIFIGNGPSSYGCVSWLLKLADESEINVHEGQIQVLYLTGPDRKQLNPMAGELLEKCEQDREPRVEHVKILNNLQNRHIRPILERAGLIVQATGYKAPRQPLLYDADGELIPTSSRGYYDTDRQSRIFDKTGRPMENLRGIGLACERFGNPLSGKLLTDYYARFDLIEWLHNA